MQLYKLFMRQSVCHSEPDIAPKQTISFDFDKMNSLARAFHTLDSMSSVLDGMLTTVI